MHSCCFPPRSRAGWSCPWQTSSLLLAPWFSCHALSPRFEVCWSGGRLLPGPWWWLLTCLIAVSATTPMPTDGLASQLLILIVVSQSRSFVVWFFPSEIRQHRFTVWLEAWSCLAPAEFCWARSLHWSISPRRLVSGSVSTTAAVCNRSKSFLYRHLDSSIVHLASFFLVLMHRFKRSITWSDRPHLYLIAAWQFCLFLW